MVLMESNPLQPDSRSTGRDTFHRGLEYSTDWQMDLMRRAIYVANDEDQVSQSPVLLSGAGLAIMFQSIQADEWLLSPERAIAKPAVSYFHQTEHPTG